MNPQDLLRATSEVVQRKAETTTHNKDGLIKCFPSSLTIKALNKFLMLFTSCSHHHLGKAAAGGLGRFNSDIK